MVRYSGVYCISHGATTLYVGSTKDICRRLGEHRRAILKGKHPNRHLRSYLKRNRIELDKLEWSVLGLCPGSQLKSLEQIWHNDLLPACCDDVPSLEDASDEFKLFIFSRILQKSRKF